MITVYTLAWQLGLQASLLCSQNRLYIVSQPTIINQIYNFSTLCTNDRLQRNILFIESIFWLNSGCKMWFQLGLFSLKPVRVGLMERFFSLKRKYEGENVSYLLRRADIELINFDACLTCSFRVIVAACAKPVQSCAFSLLEQGWRCIDFNDVPQLPSFFSKATSPPTLSAYLWCTMWKFDDWAESLLFSVVLGNAMMEFNRLYSSSLRTELPGLMITSSPDSFLCEPNRKTTRRRLLRSSFWTSPLAIILNITCLIATSSSLELEWMLVSVFIVMVRRLSRYHWWVSGFTLMLLSLRHEIVGANCFANILTLLLGYSQRWVCWLVQLMSRVSTKGLVEFFSGVIVEW